MEDSEASGNEVLIEEVTFKGWGVFESMKIGEVRF